MYPIVYFVVIKNMPEELSVFLNMLDAENSKAFFGSVDAQSLRDRLIKKMLYNQSVNNINVLNKQQLEELIIIDQRYLSDVAVIANKHVDS